MPFFGNTGPRAYDRPRLSYGATDEMAGQEATRMLGGVEFNPLQTTGYYALGGLTDLADTIGASVGGLVGADIQRGDFNRFITRSLDLPGLNDFYHQNQGGIEAASGVAAIIGSELIARRLTAPGGALMAGLRKTPYLRRIAVLDEQYAAAMSTVRATRQELASRGLVGAQQLTARATVETAVFDSTSGAMVAGLVTRSGRGADLRARMLGGAIGLRHAAATEGVLATVANQNAFLYDDSMAYNIMLGAAGLGVGGAIDWIGTGYALRKIANEDALTRTMADALDPEGLEGRRMEGFASAFGRKKVDESVDWFGGAYSDEVSELGLEIAALRNAPLSGTNDAATLDSNRRAHATELTKMQRNAAQKLTVKGLPSDGRTGFSMDTPGYGNHVDKMLHDDPMALHLVESLGGVPDDNVGTALIEGFERRVAADLEKVDSQINELLAIAESKGRLTAKQDKLMGELQQRRRRLGFQSTFTPHGVIDGELVPPSVLATYERFTPMKVFPSKLDPQKQFWEVAEDALHGKGILVGDNLEVVIPGRKAAPIAGFRQVAKRVEAALPPVQPGFTRLWRGTRASEGGKAPKYTTDLAGIALPFQESYKGPLRYVDVETSKLPKASEGGATGVEFQLSEAQVAASKVFDGDLTPPPASGGSLDSLDYYDQLALFRIADTAVDALARKADAVVNLPKKPTWFQLDMAEELLRRTDGQARVLFPQGMTRESAQVESLIQKAEALKKAEQKGMPKHLESDSWMHQMRVRLNLPKLSSYEVGLMGTEEQSLEFLLRGIANQDPDAVRAMSLDEIKEAVAQTKRLGDAAPTTRQDVKSLSGTSFRFMKQELNGKVFDMKPLVALTRPFKAHSWTADHVAERLAMRKIKALHELTGQQADPLSRELTQALTGSPDFELAARPDKILESQIQGSLVGTTPQSFAGALSKELKSSEWNFRDAPGLLGAGRLRDLAGRITRSRMKDVIEGAFGDSLKLLKNPRNASTKLLLNQYHTFRGGWDMAADPIERVVDGKKFFAFPLEDTAENQKRWEKLYEEPMPKNATLSGPDRKEIVLDEQGLDFQVRFNQATDQIIAMQNTILRANGMGQIRPQRWYVPPPEVEGKHVGWVVGPDNKLLYAVTAETPEQFARARDMAMERVAKERSSPMGHVFLTREQITDYMNIWDRAQMEMVNPGTTATLAGKRNKGGLTGANIRLDAFQHSLRQLETRILNHGNDVVELLFKEQISAAKARATFAKAVSPGTQSKTAPTNYRTVHDYYVEALLGRSKSSHPGSIIGGTARRLEGVVDQGLMWAAGPSSRAWRGVVDRLARGTDLWSKDKKAHQDFESLTKELGEHMPFKSAVELGEARERGATPLTLAKLTGGINRMTAAITLRILETAHPVMNLAGIVNAMPSVVRNMTPSAGETTEQFAARVGHAATIFKLPTGESVAAPDITKLFGRALKGAWSRKSHSDYKFMLQRGYITQEVAEFQRQFGIIEAKGRFAEGVTRLVDSASILSDKSEDFSRSIGHFIGLEVADIVGISGRERRHAFAHDIANKMIANYDPHNRAEIFQGAFGSMLGLFQSFAHNYYGRMFRYVESKDLRAFMTQYGIQSSLFGVTGLTGWDQLSGLVNWASDGERQLDTGVQGAFTGPEGDLLAHGLISQLPRLVGLPGVDLYSRGDTSVRIPGVGNTSVPGLSAITKIAAGIGEGLSSFWAENPGLTQTRIAEIMSNMVVNRPIAGMIEQFLAHGNDTDGYGQIVSETKNFAETFYRMAGVRSERQSNELQAYYSNKRAQEQQAAKKERLRLKTRSAIREGREDLIPGIFEDYVATGGDPRYFRSWMKRNYEAATQTVGTRRLDQMMDDPAAFADVMRFMDMGVGIEEDETVGAQAISESAIPQGELQEAPPSGTGTGWPYGP